MLRSSAVHRHLNLYNKNPTWATKPLFQIIQYNILDYNMGNAETTRAFKTFFIATINNQYEADYENSICGNPVNALFLIA